MKRWKRMLTAIEEELTYPPYSKFDVGTVHVRRDRCLLPGHIYRLGIGVWLAPAAEFRALAIKLCGWVPLRLLDPSYRHPRRVRR